MHVSDIHRLKCSDQTLLSNNNVHYEMCRGRVIDDGQAGGDLIGASGALALPTSDF
jgi:hypothetical protein